MYPPLIAASQLQANLANPSLRLFDCRFSLMNPAAGRTAYETSHLPGAVFVDVNSDLSTPHIAGKTGRHPLPSREQWLKTVAALGIDPESLVVLYDDGGGSSSARMWWMLKWIGHDKVAVLDGGWQAWNSAGFPVTSAVPPRKAAAAYHAKEASAAVLSAAEIDGSSQLLLDARDLPRFKGEMEPIDPVAGHIPGAVCSPASANLASDGHFKTAAELRAKFAGAEQGNRPVVCYCGSGITACHNILAMAVAGLPLPALYAGSWSDWITDPTRPIAVG